MHQTSGPLSSPQPPGSILLFLTGQDEIERACRAIQEQGDGGGDLNLEAVPLYGSLSADAQARAFATDRDQRVRKVIVGE